ncbi:MAG: substrate-binding periplasmic protein [Desulfovibrio sp.]|uniref:substrate-binding periplasmic protein n=1 Tax=Desulfovibrio sp. 7SRBS1 TaxID=3378064 RepID=UPI003B41BFD2
MKFLRFSSFWLSFVYVLVLGSLACAASDASDETAGDPLCSLKYMTEEYRPFSFRDAGGRATGLSVEVLRLVMKELGCPAPELTFYPWSMAYRILLERPGTVLFSISKSRHRMNQCKFAGPIAEMNYALVARKDAGIRVNSLRDVAGLRVGVRQDGWADAFFHFHLPTVSLARKPRIEFAVNHVRKGNLDLFAYAEPGVPALLRSMRLDPKEYEVVYVFEPVSPYYGFHKETPDAYVERFQRALDVVKTRPEFQELIEKYLE